MNICINATAPPPQKRFKFTIISYNICYYIKSLPLFRLGDLESRKTIPSPVHSFRGVTSGQKRSKWIYVYSVLITPKPPDHPNTGDGA